LADGNASMQVYQVNVSNNTAEGIRLRHLSTADFLMYPDNVNVFSGNGGAAITCDDTSMPYGDLAGISPIDCKSVQKQK
jgi:hypothetical protein